MTNELSKKLSKRLSILRETLKITQSEFANKIQISRSHLSGLEHGNRNFTERVISDICREFNVNKKWFESGEGEIFVDILSEIEEFNNADSDIQELVRTYMQLDNISKAYFKKKMIEELKK